MRNISIIILVITCLSLEGFGQSESKKISLDDIFKSQIFRPQYFSGIVHMNNGEMYAHLKNDSINLFDYKSGNFKGTIVSSIELIPPGDSTSIGMRNFTFSQNEKIILFSTKTEKIYRHSSKSYNYVYNIDEGSLIPLSDNGKQQLATTSPNGKKIAFVRNNNLFYVNLDNNEEFQITYDGEINKIINGAPDWVYEEEFSFAKGFFWSPDSKKIAYYRFDESHVKEYQMTIWGDLYPQQYIYKYPKAGEANSIVSIHVYDLENKSTTNIDLGENTDIYIPRIKWTKNESILAITKLNRLQNEMEILLADVSNRSISPIYNETNKYYVDISDDLTFLENGEHFLLSSEQDGYNHIYLFDLLGNLEQQITKGQWDVNQFLGVNEKKGILYYISSESSPINRELYSIRLDGSEKTRLSEYNGNNSVQFAKKHRYYINTFSDANSPYITTVHNAKGKLQRTIISNSVLANTIQEYGFSDKEFFSFKTSEGIDLNGWMIKPPNFNPSKKYPVLMYVYGGPGSQTVRNSWSGGSTWYQYLAQQDVIVVSVDNRGTGSRGEEFKKMTYLALGKYETFDQIEAAKYLQTLPYIDSERVGIWGWSYGGYMATSCMTKGSDYFTMGIAVAPVTNWRYYDNIYTERFMRTPQENGKGYDENSPINHVENLEGDLLIVHGTADDNVHHQNSIDLISALVKANKQFDQQFYPNSNHGIYTGANTTIHLYTLLSNYIMDHLVKKAD